MSERSDVNDVGAKGAWLDRVLGVDLRVSMGQRRAQEAAQEIAVGLGPLTMAFRKARLNWGKARTDARSTVAELQARLRAVLANEPDFAALNTEIGKFDSIIEGLDSRLETTLDEALSGADPETMSKLKAKAQEIIDEYRAFVEQHPFLRKIDGNKFMPVTVFATLSTELQNLAKELA